MSQGAFLRSRYTDNQGAIHPVRVQPETVALVIGTNTNTAPTGAITNGITARVSGSRRQIGLLTRTVTFVFTGTPPTGYLANSPLTLPWLQTTGFSTIARGATGTYLGVAIEVISTSPERVR